MEDLATEAARLLFSQGGLIGVFLVISCLINVLLYRKAEACEKARLDDTRALHAAVAETGKAVGAMALAVESNNRHMEARTRATEALAVEVKELGQKIAYEARLRDKLDEVRRGPP